MGKITGFKEFDRHTPDLREVESRVKDYEELYKPFSDAALNKQSARCMDCGVPFCHSGCPLGNRIPEFNDAVYREQWQEALEILLDTNNFPEFTGRICPAPCEGSCVLGINKPPVTIELIEKAIIEHAFDMGWMKPVVPTGRTGQKVAVVGSGPAGLACAEQLNKAGHSVTVYERAAAIGGLLRLGIPDFKLSKEVLDRRLELMKEAGIEFIVNTNVGVDITTTELEAQYDAIVLCGGATVPRDMNIPGRELKGIHFAMDFLSQQNNRVAKRPPLSNHAGISTEADILAKDKHVVVIGGGDTGSDCVGTSNRHGAATITQFELLDKPPSSRSDDNPWPQWPVILRTSSSHEEGAERKWSILTKEFLGDDEGRLKGLLVSNIQWVRGADGRMKFEEVFGSEREIPCDLALLAVGFLHGEFAKFQEGFGIGLDKRGLPKNHCYQTQNEKVFVAGDMRRGQSLVVWAISEGREAAYHVDTFLTGSSTLERKDQSLGMLTKR